MRVAVLTNARPYGKRHLKQLWFKHSAYVQYATLAYEDIDYVYGVLFIFAHLRKPEWWLSVRGLSTRPWTRSRT